MPAGGLSFRATLLIANATSFAFLAVYYSLLGPARRLKPGSHPPAASGHVREQQQGSRAHATAAAAGGGDEDALHGGERQRLLVGPRSGVLAGGSTGPHALHGGGYAQPSSLEEQDAWDDVAPDDDELGDDAKASKACRMTWRERLERTAALWPYMVPLMVVYFAEYAMQSGTWTAIGGFCPAGCASEGPRGAACAAGAACA